MKITLEKIKEKYPDANYLPDSECQKCKGRGEWHDNNRKKYIKTGMRPCICIFVEHSFAPEAAKMLSELASSELKKMNRTHQ